MFKVVNTMAKNKKESSKRNPSRTIKMHDRDEILKRVSAERRGKTRQSRSSRIREQVYSEPANNSERRRKERLQNNTSKKKERPKKKINGVLSLKSFKEVPTSNELFLYFKKSEKGDIISTGVKDERSRSTVVIQIVALFLLLATAVYGIIFAVNYLRRTVVANDTVIYGSIESGQLCRGVIVRDEVLYNSPADGEAVFSVSDSDKVKANAQICSVQDTAAVENLQTDLDKINEQILEMQKTRESISAVSDEVKQYNTQIKANADNYAFRLTGGDITTLYSMKSDVQKLMDSRNQRLLSENSGSLSDLAEQRAQQQTKITNSQNAVYTQDGGIISCYSDGLEASYTLDKLSSFSEKETSVRSSGKALSKNVKAGDPLFRVVRSNEWYIASYIPNSQIETWTVGDTRTIYMHGRNDESVPLEVEVSSINTGDKTSYVIMKETKFLIDYINSRSVEFETSKAVNGFKVPNSAIVEQTMLKVSKEFVVNNSVYKKVDEDTFSQLNVVPAGEDTEDGKVYIPFDINRINVGDVLVMPDDKTKTFAISEVVTVKGVFVMNTGIADFCKINLENSVSNENYTVLDPSLNGNIKIYDRIVTDTLNIEKQQKLIS